MFPGFSENYIHPSKSFSKLAKNPQRHVGPVHSVIFNEAHKIPQHSRNTNNNTRLKRYHQKQQSESAEPNGDGGGSNEESQRQINRPPSLRIRPENCPATELT